ncbi:helix-turn-helix domain-containing protein [Staphylococcus aureus]|uniref:helix-turn-helix domain-containing protein n=1 Tax=Staphylococcus aureus TaxID=1280 RepID=UPI000993BF97|nr:helix-turn-helix domain-containing protein [Staphylococcus aureus]
MTKIMNQFKEIYNTIEKLLNDKSISNYRINQDTGISYGGISELRSGKRKVNNLTLETAEKLYNYQKQLEIMIED